MLSQIDISAFPVLKFNDRSYVILKMEKTSSFLICLSEENIRIVEILLNFILDR